MTKRSHNSHTILIVLEETSHFFPLSFVFEFIEFLDLIVLNEKVESCQRSTGTGVGRTDYLEAEVGRGTIDAGF